MLLILATLAVYESRCKLRCSLNTNKIETDSTTILDSAVHITNVRRYALHRLRDFCVRSLRYISTLVCLIDEQGLISIQGGKFFKKNKPTGPNKSTWLKKF